MAKLSETLQLTKQQKYPQFQLSYDKADKPKLNVYQILIKAPICTTLGDNYVHFLLASNSKLLNFITEINEGYNKKYPMY
ncbi:hypothetical protein BdWA1_000776 [Babesia duncani]|uniref:Uncharacterized protein n=1 Tax=Babesia duncani TaxID=323732 RepID=A0AAD9PNT4_9APIC|nr:hypothetical protein BdWA1_000776 [Babesia duncani]